MARIAASSLVSDTFPRQAITLPVSTFASGDSEHATGASLTCRKYKGCCMRSCNAVTVFGSCPTCPLEDMASRPCLRRLRNAFAVKQAHTPGLIYTEHPFTMATIHIQPMRVAISMIFILVAVCLPVEVSPMSCSSRNPSGFRLLLVFSGCQRFPRKPWWCGVRLGGLTHAR